MEKIAVIGGGIAGASAAVELAEAGYEVIILEKSEEIGGNVKHYGCKAVDVCTKCNLCLVDDILFEVLENENIDVLYNTRVNDLRGKQGNYSLGIEREGEYLSIANIDTIVLATGYKKWSDLETGTPEIFADERILWASEVEDILENRLDHIENEDPVGLDMIPESVAFIQCNGSRSIQEKAKYCSKICCGYNYRLARVFKYFYPDVEVTMFFMDIQEGGYITNITFDLLEEEDIKYKNCKPIKLENKGDKLKLIYEDQKFGKIDEVLIDMLVLSEGIRPGEENEKWSKIFNLQLDEYGFLYPIEEEKKTGIYLAGTIKGPKDIANTISDSKNVAYRIINNSRNILKSGG